MIMRLIRSMLTPVLLAYEKMASPPAMPRGAEEQRRVDEETRSLSLYQFRACPFCVKVRMAMKRLGLNIELRDVLKNDADKKELLEKGGEIQVPCLRIREASGEKWVYESDEIIRYLEERFGPKRTQV